MANKKQLTPEEVAAAVCTCRTRKEAAAMLKIGDRTLFDYLQDFQVQAAIASIRAEQSRRRFEALDAITDKAVSVLSDVLDSNEATNAEKIRAAQIVLDAGRIARADAAAIEKDAIGQSRNARVCEFRRQGDIRAQDARERGILPDIGDLF